MHKRSAYSDGFTLIEMIVVILIIITLMGLVFTASQGLIDRARKTQAKNDVIQIVTAVNAFYTEYGMYPIPTASQGSDYPTPGPTPMTTNSAVINALRAKDATLNPRNIVFFSPPQVSSTPARSAVVSTSAGNSPVEGIYYDPWAGVYQLRIDGDYNNAVANPYSSNAGPTSLAQGVIAWSLGKNKLGGSGDKSAGNAKDDVISWQ